MNIGVTGGNVPRSTTTTTDQQPATIAAGNSVTAAGNVGLSATPPPSRIDKAWTNNYVPAVIVPRPPLHALVLAGGNSELVRQVNNLLNDKKADPANVLSVMDLMRSKILELSMDGETQSMQDRQTRIEKNQKEREVELAAAKEKMLAAAKQEEKNKVTNILMAIGSIVASVAMIAIGAVLAPVGGGLLVAYGTYSLVNAGFDLADSVRAAQGKEPIGWRPSVGELAGRIAKAFGADEETQLKANVGAELAFAVVMMIATMGAGSATGGAKAIKTGADALNKSSKLANALSKGVNYTQGALALYQAKQSIDTALLKYDQAEQKSRLDRLQVQYDQFNEQMKTSLELMKTLQEAYAAVWDVAAERLKSSNEALTRTWGGGRGNMI